MQCATGCSDCCHVRLTITEVEATAIRAHVGAWPRQAQAQLADTGQANHCAALDAAGRCRIYDARPLVCRSHGVPVRLRQGGLPVVQSCHRNFRTTTPDPDCILDQATLSATVLAIDAAEARAPAPGSPGGSAPGRRVELAALLAELAAI